MNGCALIFSGLPPALGPDIRLFKPSQSLNRNRSMQHMKLIYYCNLKRQFYLSAIQQLASLHLLDAFVLQFIVERMWCTINTGECFI